MFLYLYKCLKRHVCSAPGKGMMKSAGAGGGGDFDFCMALSSRAF